MDDKVLFEKNMTKLGDYFGVTITPEILRIYYDELSYITPLVFKEICRKIINDRRPIKSHFPTITQFGPLHAAHKPEGVISKFEEQPCDECHGSGLLYFKYWDFDYGTIYQSMAACSQCKNWQRHFNTLEPHAIYTGDGKFITMFPGIEQCTKEQLAFKKGAVEVSEDGVFRMSMEQLSKQVLELYGET